jgi:hypothetical protein
LIGTLGTSVKFLTSLIFVINSSPVKSNFLTQIHLSYFSTLRLRKQKFPFPKREYFLSVGLNLEISIKEIMYSVVVNTNTRITVSIVFIQMCTVPYCFKMLFKGGVQRKLR